MPRRLKNWSYQDVTNFLKENGFSFRKEASGSHQAWIKRGKNNQPDIIVGVNFCHDGYPIGTMKRMIRESGIDEKEWIKWAGS